jgi:hypothetical protein
MFLVDQAGRSLARYLTRPLPRPLGVSSSPPHALVSVLRPGDVLLVEGDTRISVAIKYLTQSSWSHATLCVAAPGQEAGEDSNILLEADVNAGVRIVPLRSYAVLHTRICRPVGLRPDEIAKIIAFATAQVGRQYDTRHVWDLARYLFPTPPVPTRWRRRMLAIGHGDPTRAICSTLIAEAYQQAGYPILPEVILSRDSDVVTQHSYAEMRHIQEHGLYMPRDFDVSPYFEIVKPTLALGFDPHQHHSMHGLPKAREA